MIKQLKKLFPSLCIRKYFDELHDEYEWFITNEDELIGILKAELSQKDEKILSAFLKRYDMTFPVRTAKEAKWNRQIFSSNRSELTVNQNYRFVHFFIHQKQIDPISFKEAIDELFAREVAILWVNESEGIIIEEQDQSEDPISYNQIINVLMSDLYVKINFFVGKFQQTTEHIRQYYDSVIEGSKISLKYLKQSVTTYVDIIPSLFIDQADETMRNNIATSVLKKFKDDQETLKMIETFIDCNLNVSVTAKELYMHRNSLQYRLDKFTEQTNIDIRHFHQAMAVYLALLGYKSI